MNLPHENPQNPQKSIWVIDDDQSMRWVLTKTLANNGYQVTAFESGSVALSSFKRAASEELPSLIITDVRMPGINGFELLKQVKNISPRTPIIVMTAYTDLDTTKHAFHEGAFEYLPKPFDIDDAIDLVGRACAQADDRGAISAQQLPSDIGDWQSPLRTWAKQQLSQGETDILKNAARTFEKTLLDCALEATRGRKQDAARLLGWGRNTLTRKLKELG
ncbi:MAG TPA: response regulator [Gammaproteobacteria bacterium]|nr:response regulator [Gammaproteobacteria bacterium]